MAFYALLLLVCIIVVAYAASESEFRDIDLDYNRKSFHSRIGDRYGKKSSIDLRSEIAELQKTHNSLIKDGKDDEAENLQRDIAQRMEEMHNAIREERSDRRDYSRNRHDDIRDRSRFDSRSRHHDPRASRHEMELEKENKFHDMIRGRIDKWIQQLEGSNVPADEMDTIRKDIEDYYQMELHLINARKSITLDFERAREIDDKDERRKYLDKAREAREAKRIEDDKIREVVIQKRAQFAELVKIKTGDYSEL